MIVTAGLLTLLVCHFFSWRLGAFVASSLPFGNVLSVDRVRDIFAGSDVLFGFGENDLWNTGLTLWSFIGQVLQDGKQSSCNAAVTNATRYMLEHGMPPDESIRQALGKHNLFQIACNEVGNQPGRIEPRVIKRRPKSYQLMTKPRNQYK